MFPPNSTNVPPNSNGAVTQEIKLTNSMHGQKNIMLKLKIGYKQGVTMVSISNKFLTTLNLYLIYVLILG